ncbi:MAG: hypothetical protein AAF628_11855 [Planctomycetota bacterium]
MRPLSLSLLTTCVGLGSLLAAQQPAIAGDVRTIDVDGARTKVRVFSDDTGLRAQVSRDGGQSWQRLERPDYQLSFQYADFDPRLGEPVVPNRLAAVADSRMFLVQFETPIIGEYRDALRRAGAELTQQSYVPTQSYLVRMDRADASALSDLPFVRWVGDYHPAYRVEPAIVADVVAGVDNGARRYNILLMEKKADESRLQRFIERVGGTVEVAASGGLMLTATLNDGQLLQVANHDAVLWLDRWTESGNDMDNALVQTGADMLHALGTPIDGKGMTGHVFEGVHTTHPEFAAIAPYRTTPQFVVGGGSASHGTSTAGEIWARGVHPTNPNFRGGVPFSQMWYTTPRGISRHQLYADLTDPGGPIKAMATTASWGGSRSTTYTSESADTDDAIFDANIFGTNSQSNAGAQPSRPQAWAKNMNGIGGFLHRNNANPNDDCWCRTGSIGPASDGRIGVTFAGYYESILTTSLSSGYSASFGGTSGATPMVNGVSQLIIQMHTEGLTGYDAVAWPDRFTVKPNFTTSRVMVMSTTRQVPYNQQGTSQGANRFQVGWGVPHVGDYYNLRNEIMVIDEDNATMTGASRDVLAQGDERDYVVFVKPGTPEFRVAMTYADVAGNPSVQSQHRVNDLDLTVTGPDGSVYVGNAGLRGGPTSAPMAVIENEKKDTEEMVIVEGPTPGAYVVNVRAASVTADTHVETAAMDADFALAVRGVGGSRDTSGMVLDVASFSRGNLRVSVSNVPASGWTTGYTFFSADTARRAALGNVFGLEWDVLASSIAGSAPSAGGLFAFTNGGPSAYPQADFQIPGGLAAALSGTTLDAIVVLFDASGSPVAASNVDRETVQ